MHTHDQHFHEVELSDLRPTQITVGLAEVALKRMQWQRLDESEREKYLASHWFPAVRGPKQHHYITDHHHLGLALIEEGVKTAKLLLMKDYSALEMSEFWIVMDLHQWVHPYDQLGKRQDFNAVPKKLSKLVDDPYRSLAGAVRSAGGYPKDSHPFAEFVWADFFRRRIPLKALKSDPQRALSMALELAHGKQAEHMPGWSGLQA